MCDSITVSIAASTSPPARVRCLAAACLASGSRPSPSMAAATTARSTPPAATGPWVRIGSSVRAMLRPNSCADGIRPPGGEISTRVRPGRIRARQSVRDAALAVRLAGGVAGRGPDRLLPRLRRPAGPRGVPGRGVPDADRAGHDGLVLTGPARHPAAGRAAGDTLTAEDHETVR